LTSARTVKVVGDGGKVTGLDVEDRVSGKTSHLPFDGVFVQIGLVPNSECVKGLVTLNRYGEIEVDSRGRTNVHGIYGAGDVTTTPHKQIIIAMGEGAKVALSAFEDTMRGD
jgi:alkyl hydroperoxide reductase subunit F